MFHFGAWEWIAITQTHTADSTQWKARFQRWVKKPLSGFSISEYESHIDQKHAERLHVADYDISPSSLPTSSTYTAILWSAKAAYVSILPSLPCLKKKSKWPIYAQSGNKTKIKNPNNSGCWLWRQILSFTKDTLRAFSCTKTFFYCGDPVL